MNDKAISALRALVEWGRDHTSPTDADGPHQLLIDAATVLAEIDAPFVGRWRCPCCKSDNVQISLPTWYRESVTHDLEFVDTDAEADISWWYCYECGETDSGTPDDVLEGKEAQS